MRPPGVFFALVGAGGAAPPEAHFKAAEAALGKSYEIHAYSVFSIGSQNSESELDAVG